MKRLDQRAFEATGVPRVAPSDDGVYEGLGYANVVRDGGETGGGGRSDALGVERSEDG